jgi:hypothetical protein
MEQPRLVARRRRVDFVFRSTRRALPGSKVKSRIAALPYLHFAFSTLVGYNIYDSGEIGLSCFLSITIHKNSPFT